MSQQLQQIQDKLAAIKQERRTASAIEFVNKNLVNFIAIAGLGILGYFLFKTNVSDIGYAQSKCSADAQYYYQFCQAVATQKSNWLAINSRIIGLDVICTTIAAALFKYLWIEQTFDQQLQRLGRLENLEQEFHELFAELDTDNVQPGDQKFLEGIVADYTKVIYCLPPSKLQELDLLRNTTTEKMRDLAFQYRLPEEVLLQ